MYYLFINENQKKKYDGEILKRYVGNKLVKVISNPTEQDLKDFTYMELVCGTEPEYDAETQKSHIKSSAFELSCPIYRIEKEREGFNENDLSTIRVKTTKIK